MWNGNSFSITVLVFDMVMYYIELIEFNWISWISGYCIILNDNCVRSIYTCISELWRRI